MNSTLQAAQTIDQAIQQAREQDAEFARNTFHMGYSVQQLRDAFSIVQNPSNWKLPINAAVGPEESTIRLYKTAIEFMVGGPTQVLRRKDHAVIKNAGYYANIGA